MKIESAHCRASTYNDLQISTIQVFISLDNAFIVSNTTVPVVSNFPIWLTEGNNTIQLLVDTSWDIECIWTCDGN